MDHDRGSTWHLSTLRHHRPLDLKGTCVAALLRILWLAGALAGGLLGFGCNADARSGVESGLEVSTSPPALHWDFKILPSTAAPIPQMMPTGPVVAPPPKSP